MVPYEGRFLPEVHNEYCVGCGACETCMPDYATQSNLCAGEYSSFELQRNLQQNKAQESGHIARVSILKASVP